MTIIFYYSIFMHLGSGPRWPGNEPIVNMCHKFWRSLLFIENIADDGTSSCLVWGWYLQVDFQMFLVCLLLLGVYSYQRKISIALGVLMIVGSWTYNLIYTQVHGQHIFINTKSLMAFLDYFQDIYVKPWARWSPYILGMFLGLAHAEYTTSLKDQSKRTGLIAKCHQLK
jgi:ABC-type sugar transport system permease subunit